MTTPEKPENPEETNKDRSGVSRRHLLGGTGATAAAAVFVGLGNATAANASPLGEKALVTPDALQPKGPHTFTARTRGVAPGMVTKQSTGPAQIRILPIDRAKFLAGGRFDLRVEAAGVDPTTARVRIAVTDANGRPARILVGQPNRTSSVPGSLEVTYTDLFYRAAGQYTVKVTVTSNNTISEASVSHDVVTATSADRPAKNVIFFLGDGMGQAAITGARVLSKGISEGKYHGMLEMDQMQFRGHVTTSGSDALATDSANSMSAYMTGHKSSTNAMGVYEGNNPDPTKHPKVETFAELIKRTTNKSIGIVTTAEIQDATPAAVTSHTRRRNEYINIMDQVLDPKRTPDVLMGGGLASLLPKSQPGSRRPDERNLVDEFRVKGFSYAQTRTQLQDVMRGNPQKLLGLFQNGNLNVYLDRQHQKNPDVLGQWTDQPGLVEMTQSALQVLGQKKDGFFLMVEGASIDKQEHPMDGPRALYDTIEFDQAIGFAKKWAEQHGDTLVVVTADHNHAMSIGGTHVRKDGATGREANGVYGDSTFPTYVDTNGDGFPDDPNPEIELFFGWSNHPDHTDDFQHNPVPVQPAVLADGRAVPNPAHDPGAELQTGNLPFEQVNCVHTVEDVLIMASGPGSSRFNATLDNTEVFFAVADALHIDALRTKPGRGRDIASQEARSADEVAPK